MYISIKFFAESGMKVQAQGEKKSNVKIPMIIIFKDYILYILIYTYTYTNYIHIYFNRYVYQILIFLYCLNTF